MPISVLTKYPLQTLQVNLNLFCIWWWYRFTIFFLLSSYYRLTYRNIMRWLKENLTKLLFPSFKGKLLLSASVKHFMFKHNYHRLSNCKHCLYLKLLKFCEILKVLFSIFVWITVLSLQIDPPYHVITLNVFGVLLWKLILFNSKTTY